MEFPQSELRELLHSARELAGQGRARDAETMLRVALDLDPSHPEALLGHAAVAASLGMHEDSLASATRLVELQPLNFEAKSLVGWSRFHLGDYIGAEEYGRQLLESQGQNPRILHLLGLSLAAQGNLGNGLEMVERALMVSPFDAHLMATKAQFLARLNWTSQSLEWYRKSLKLQPNRELAIEYSQLLREEGFTDLAVGAMTPYLATDSEFIVVQLAAAQALTEAHRFEEADTAWQTAHRLGADTAELTLQRVQSELYAGRIGVAKALIDEALDLNPDQCSLYLTLSAVQRFQASDQRLIDRMEALRSTAGPADLKRDLSFALGKAYADVGEYKRSMAAYDEANLHALELNPNACNFDSDAWSWYTDQQIRFFSKERVAKLQAQGSRSAEILFVIGMIRSGTTLTEQILSRHPNISAGGEKTFWADHREEVFHSGRLEFDAMAGAKLANAYLKLMKSHQVSGEFVTEKNPAYITIAAMLACVFPNSKFVHVKRDPVDNLLSIWMTPLRTGLPFVNSKSNLVSAFRDYQRLEIHFREVLPEQSFRTVSYEDLTSSPERTIPELLHWLGLEPDERCWHPESNVRTVRTPSYYQVRQPISTGSQGKWKHYLPWLGEFAELLEGG